MVIVDDKKLPLVPAPSEEPPAYTPNEASSSRGHARGAAVRGVHRGRGRGGGGPFRGGPPPRASTSGAGPSSIPGQSPSFTNPTEQPIVRTNHLRLHRQNDPLKGRWLIDTSLQLPAGLLDPLPEGETVRPNLYLSSENSQVYADVEIEGPKTEKAVVIASSTNGPVTVQILRRTGPLSLAASSTNSSITIFLPQDFQGPLNWKTKHGTVKFSPMLQSRLTQFGQKRNNPDNIISNMLIAAFKSIFPSPNDTEGMEYGFIGQWVGSGYDDVDDVSEWKGDYCEVRNVHGPLKFAYIDEPKEPNVFEGLLKGLFGGG